LIAHGRGVYRPGGGCRACVCDGGRDPTRTPAVLCSCQAGACADASTTRRLHAYACEGADENSWQSRPRHTHARNKVLLSAALVVPSAQPPKSECERAARRLPAKRRRRPTFFAIVLASSSNMTRARSAAVVPRGGSRPGVGLRTACLGLDCHEFSSKPSHTNAWSTRFLPGHMFPVKAQTITAVARVLKRCERARLRLEAPSATRCVPRGGWAWRWAQTQRCGADPRSFSPASAAAFLRARITSLPSRWRGVQ